MLTLPAARRMRFVGLAGMLPAAAFAADNFGQSLLAITPLAWIGLVVLSSVIGVTSLLHKLVKRMEDNRPLANLPLYATAHMFGSYSMGLVALFGGESAGLSGANITLGIIFGSFSGAVALQAASDRYMNAPRSGSGKTELGDLR